MQLPSVSLLVLVALSLSACGDDKGDATGDLTTTQTSATTGTSEASSTGEPVTGSTSVTPTTGEPGTSTGDLSSSGSDSSGAVDSTSTGSTTGVTGLSLAADVYPVWNPPIRCDCHTPGSGGLKMGTPEEAYMNLVGVMANEAPMLSRIEPGDREASYLWHKIHGTQVEIGGSGSQMPLGAPPLDQEVIDLIGQWIDEGAQP